MMNISSIGETAGGEGGDRWGSVWTGYWFGHTSLRMVYEKTYLSEMGGKRKKLEYSYNSKTKILSTITKESTFKSFENNRETYSDWTIISTEETELGEKIEGM